jgi:hypothetical protein
MLVVNEGRTFQAGVASFPYRVPAVGTAVLPFVFTTDVNYGTVSLVQD